MSVSCCDLSGLNLRYRMKINPPPFFGTSIVFCQGYAACVHVDPVVYGYEIKLGMLNSTIWPWQLCLTVHWHWLKLEYCWHNFKLDCPEFSLPVGWSFQPYRKLECTPLASGPHHLFCLFCLLCLLWTTDWTVCKWKKGPNCCQSKTLPWSRFLSQDSSCQHSLQKGGMYYPGPPPPIADSRLNNVQMEEGGELLPIHKTALVQVDISKFNLSWHLL